MWVLGTALLTVPLGISPEAIFRGIRRGEVNVCWILLNCRLRNGQAPKCCSGALLPGGTWDVGTVRWWVDPGVEEEHTCPNTSCDRGSPSLGPVALEFSLLLPETVCTGLASVALAASKTTSWSWSAQELRQGLAHTVLPTASWRPAELGATLCLCAVPSYTQLSSVRGGQSNLGSGPPPPCSGSFTHQAPASLLTVCFRFRSPALSHWKR